MLSFLSTGDERFFIRYKIPALDFAVFCIEYFLNAS